MVPLNLQKMKEPKIDDEPQPKPNKANIEASASKKTNPLLVSSPSPNKKKDSTPVLPTLPLPADK